MSIFSLESVNLGSMETLASDLCPTYWVERGNKNDRREFLTEVIKKAKVYLGMPVYFASS